MHNLTKIKIFRILLWITYPVCLVFIYPLAMMKKKKSSSLFFMFDRYSIGGAQKVYLDILESVNDIGKTIYFTRKSPGNELKETFYSTPHSFCRDIHFWCDNLLLRLFSVHFYSFYINRHHCAKILSSNSTFFYDMLPFLNKKAQCIELFHNFSYGKKGMEFFGLANYKYLDYRMVIDSVTKQNIIDQYKQYDLNNEYKSRIIVVEYGVDIPATMTEKNTCPPLKVLYAGRGSAQKRIWLLNDIVELCLQKGIPAEFTFVGSMVNELSEKVKSNCRVYDQIGDRNEMNKLFREMHAIILTSAFEGFPVVIKEAMSYACIPIVTALPGNKIHLKHLENALLMNSTENEKLIVEEAINNILLLINNPGSLREISANAYNYASTYFKKEAFHKFYRTLLLNI